MLMVALVATSAYAADVPSVSVLVPVVGSILGANEVHWKTDIELLNDGRQELVVALSLPTAPDQPAILITIPPGATQRFNDVVGEAFGMEAALSPLRVQTMGRRSVRVSASVYGVRGNELTHPESIPLTYSDSYHSQRTLNGLSFSDAFRTNIGLVNLGDHEASFTLAVQRLPGRNLAVARLTIPPNSLAHTAIQSVFPLITKGDDFSVVVETSSRDTYVYASVIDNATSEARFITPVAGAPSAR
jgi:hypothetical protein